jgi:hypothetical protein
VLEGRDRQRLAGAYKTLPRWNFPGFPQGSVSQDLMDNMRGEAQCEEIWNKLVRDDIVEMEVAAI